jgi:hypothetical protein
MGIFGVNMPMLYGEGERAFIRLQEEIMKLSDDQTIFAWRSVTWWDHDGGFLAPSPTAFIDSGNFIWPSRVTNSVPFAVTNKGLHIELALKARDDPKTYLAILNCKEIGKDGQLLAVQLRDVSETGEIFIRERSDKIEMINAEERTGLPLRSVYVRQGRPARRVNAASYGQCFIKMAGAQECGFSLHEIYPTQSWMRSDGTVTSMTPLYDGIFGALSFHDKSGNNFVVMLKRQGTLICVNVVMQVRSETLKEVFWSFDENFPKSQARQRKWINEPDRIFRACSTIQYTPLQHQDDAKQLSFMYSMDQGWIIVAIRRQIISDQKYTVVDISADRRNDLYSNQGTT